MLLKMRVYIGVKPVIYFLIFVRKERIELKSIFEFFINYKKTALQIFFYFTRMFIGS